MDPDAAAAVQRPPLTSIFCSWCGKERAVDALALHHCGSMDRPAVYCMGCGVDLVKGAAACAACGTPTEETSRRR